MSSKLLLLSLLVIQGGVLVELNSQETPEEEKTRLFNYLFNNYDKNVEPHHADLKFDLGILCAWGSGRDEPLVASVVEKYIWTDRRLAWDPQKFGDVSHLRLSDELVWKPDMKLYNALEATEYRDSCNVELFHNGTIIWFPRAVYKTFCKSDPCQYNVGLWTYDGLIMPMSHWGYEPINKYYHNDACPLTLLSVTVAKHINYFPCLEGVPYAFFQFNATYGHL